MKTYIILLALFVSILTHSQTPQNIEVNVSEEGSSEKIELSLFHLNHVLYIKAFILSDIYSSVSSSEMAFINETLIDNIGNGKRTQFIITTSQKVPYRLAVFVVKKEDKKLLVILTNFNPETGKFEKKIKDDFYATSPEIFNNVVVGDMFELPLKNEKKYLADNDYLALINMSVFNKNVDTIQINNWFTLAEEKQSDKVNNLNWLKSYYHLTQFNFTESQKYLDELKKSVANSPEDEKNQWDMFVKVLTSEINILKEMKN